MEEKERGMQQKNIHKRSFWDFRNNRKYSCFGERNLDFWSGLIVGGIILRIIPGYFVLQLASMRWDYYHNDGKEISDLPTCHVLWVLVIYTVMILIALYLLKKRKYLAFGFLTSLLFSILFFVLVLG